MPLVIARAAATPEASAPSSPCEDRGSKASAASPHAIQPCPHTVSSHAPPAGDTCGADQSMAAPAKPPRLGRAPKRVTKCSWHRSRRASPGSMTATALIRRWDEAPTYHQPSASASRNIRAGGCSRGVVVRACTATNAGPVRRTAPSRRATAAVRPVASITHRAEMSAPAAVPAIHPRPRRRRSRNRPVRSATPRPTQRCRSSESNRFRSIHHPGPSGAANASDATNSSLPHADSVPPHRPSITLSIGSSPAPAKARVAAPGRDSLWRWFADGR